MRLLPLLPSIGEHIVVTRENLQVGRGRKWQAPQMDETAAGVSRYEG
jgi:hypothetical protein